MVFDLEVLVAVLCVTVFIVIILIIISTPFLTIIVILVGLNNARTDGCLFTLIIFILFFKVAVGTICPR